MGVNRDGQGMISLAAIKKKRRAYAIARRARRMTIGVPTEKKKPPQIGAA